MTKWCLLLVIISVLESAHQFPSNEKEIYNDSASDKLLYEETFNQCQNILTQIIERLKHKEEIFGFSRQKGTLVNYWMFEMGISDRNHWCKSESKNALVLIFSWNSDQINCVNVEVSNDNGTPKSTEYMCDLNINSSITQRGFTILTSDSETITKSKMKRSLIPKTINAFVNLAKEIESTECSAPTLNIYLNKQLVFSNESRVVGKNVPMDDIIEIYIDVDLGSFTNSIPGRMLKRYFINTEKRTFFQAKEDCLKKSMSLLTLRSKEETDEVLAAMSEYKDFNFWISGNKLSGDWSWSNGERLEYTNWIPTNPNNAMGIENCIEITQEAGKWNDLDCAVKRPSICESILSRTEEIPPKINIFVDENLVYHKPAYGNNQDQANVVEVKIGVNGNVVEDHSTRFLLVKKNSAQEAASEQRLVIPRNSMSTDGIEIRIENINQKGLICQKEKIYHVYTEEKLSYIDAHKFCKNNSMQLVSIQNEMQNSQIEEILLKLNLDHYYWTSGYLAVDGASWLWNGNEAVTYSNWAKGEPNNLGDNEKCIEIFVPWKTTK